MNLWQFVTAKGVSWTDATEDVRTLLDRLTLDIIRDRRPIIRKVSAHGLGHLMPPTETYLPTPGIPAPVFDLGKAGVKRWHYDV